MSSGIQVKEEQNPSGEATESPRPAPEAVLRLFAEYDIYDYLYWNSDVRFFVNVNDVFFWGCADLEEIVDLDALETAIKDCTAIDADAEDFGCWLYAARHRGIRPQGASYPENQALWPLFDACGSEREVGFGNPYRPGEYQPSSTFKVPERDAETQQGAVESSLQH